MRFFRNAFIASDKRKSQNTWICIYSRLPLSRNPRLEISGLYETLRDIRTWKRGEIAPNMLLPVGRSLCVSGTRFSIRDKRLFEISEVEITRVDCIRLTSYTSLSVAKLLIIYVYWSSQILYKPRQAKKCLRACAECADSHHPAHAQCIIRSLFSTDTFYSILNDSDSGQRKSSSDCASAAWSGPSLSEHAPEGGFSQGMAHLSK